MGFWNGKNVLVTGHTGFKGSWLSLWLHMLGAKVSGYSLDPSTSEDMFCTLDDTNIFSNDFRSDIRDLRRLEDAFAKVDPDIVFHLAAQPLVRQSYVSPSDTYEVNVMGTLNVLENIRAFKPKVSVIITTDKCYFNHEQYWSYRENDRLGGYDPYSSSKACVELLVDSYRNSFFNLSGNRISTARAGNVIGGGDWSTDRLVPDCIRSIEEGKVMTVRNPQAVRPWQHVLEPLNGYLKLAEKMYKDEFYVGAWNFGPNESNNVTVLKLIESIFSSYGKGEYQIKNVSDFKHESGKLTLDATKAKYLLDWRPKLSFKNTIEYTVEWYKKRAIAMEIAAEQIRKYEAL